jgi:hypothetical protein
MKVITIQAARGNATLVHLALDRQPLQPLCKSAPGRYVPAGDSSNCPACPKRARSMFLDIDGLVRISSRVWNLIGAVKVHATANYDTAGWDIAIEAYSDAELAELVQSCRTPKGAIARVADALSIYTERRSYHRAEAAAATDQPEPVVPALPKPESIIRWTGSAETEWYGVETWPGKVGHNEYDPNGGVRYVSGFHMNLTSPGACDHSSRGGGFYCRQDGCRHAECVVPF